MSKRAKEAALKAYPDSHPDFIEINIPRFVKVGRRHAYIEGYEQAEKDTIARIREQVKQWMPEKDGEEYTDGKRLAFNSVLHLLEEMENYG